MAFIAKFGRFRCEKVLPLVFDDSLSYYELLCKVLQKLNETIDKVNEHETRLESIETYLDTIEEKITERDEAIHDLQNRVTTIEGDVTNITQILGEHTDDLADIDRRVTKNTNDIARLGSRVSVLEGYAFEGIIPATPEDLQDMTTYIEQYITNIIGDIQEQIDAITGGGYTPTYGSVDFGLGTLLKADPTEADPNHMVIASQDFQVSAAYVQAGNMVYGCFYISQSEGAEVIAMPGDTFVLCWKNSTDLPPIASDFPGVKVRWDANALHTPDLFKMGIDYNNTFTKRVDCFFGKRDQYPEYLGSGYKWYAPVYLDDIKTGSPVTNWSIIQIPFCYLSLRNLSQWEYELGSTTFDGTRYVDTGVKPFSSSSNGRSWEFYMSVTVNQSEDANLNHSFLVSCDTSCNTGTGAMYWTGGAGDDNLTHSQMLVHDPGFGIGGGSYTGTTSVQQCIRGTNFRKRGNITNLKTVVDDSCVENVLHVVYNATEHKFTTELTFKMQDETETTNTYELNLVINDTPMEFTDSDQSIILGACLTSSYNIADGVIRNLGTASNNVVMNYFRFRHIAD